MIPKSAKISIPYRPVCIHGSNLLSYLDNGYLYIISPTFAGSNLCCQLVEELIECLDGVASSWTLVDRRFSSVCELKAAINNQI
jgi:hypothetical protein